MFTGKLSWLNPYVKQEKDCWIWIGSISQDGYARVFSVKHTQGKTQKVTRIIMSPIPQGLVVRHKCKNRSCINPEHLELGTVLENVQDRYRDNTHQRGVKNKRAKLNEEAVLDIRNGSNSLSQLMLKYGISKPQIHSIRRGKSWKHLGGNIVYHGNPVKLTPDQVKSIREDTRKGRIISEEYGISISQVSRIRNHKQRKDVK